MDEIQAADNREIKIGEKHRRWLHQEEPILSLDKASEAKSQLRDLYTEQKMS